MNEFKIHKISKLELANLKEDDLMFITNPGRMGDEDGITFIIRHNNELTIYRVDGWLYPKAGEKEDVLLNDIEKQFPKWLDTWKHSNDKEYKGKYRYLYMGFGNGLSVDNSLYKEFEQYLNVLVEEYLEGNNAEEKESLQYAAVFNVWQKALINMANAKGYILKR